MRVWACQAKGHSCHTKFKLYQIIYENKRVKVQSTSCHYATKRPVKITMYLGLNIITKLLHKKQCRTLLTAVH